MNNFMKTPIENRNNVLVLIGGVSVILVGICILIAVFLMSGKQPSTDVLSSKLTSQTSTGNAYVNPTSITSSQQSSVTSSNTSISQSKTAGGNANNTSANVAETVKNYNVDFNFNNGTKVSTILGLVGARESIHASYPTAAAYPESTPIFFNSGGTNYITVTSAWSTILGYESGRKPTDLFNKDLTFVVSNSWWLASDTLSGYGAVATGKATPVSTQSFNNSANWNDGVPYWKRSYNGIFDIVTAKVNGKEYIFSVNHGENKNEKFSDGRKYSNTIQPRTASGLYADNQYSGVGANGVYNDYANGYFAFTSLNVLPASELKNGVRFDNSKYDKGPILWPSNGYLDTSDNRANPGMRHPSLFVSNGYLYVYYVDGSSIRVARSPLSALGDPSSFKIYSNGSFSLPSLVAGFNKNSRDYFHKGTGSSAQILSNSNSLRFSVSKLQGTDYYLGVEEYFTNWPVGGIKLHLSKDLCNWSDGYIIPGYSWNDYNKGYLHYPMFYNETLTDKSEINPKGFYIVGQYGNNIGKARTDRQKISITIK